MRLPKLLVISIDTGFMLRVSELLFILKLILILLQSRLRAVRLILPGLIQEPGLPLKMNLLFYIYLLVLAAMVESRWTKPWTPPLMSKPFCRNPGVKLDIFGHTRPPRDLRPWRHFRDVSDFCTARRGWVTAAEVTNMNCVCNGGSGVGLVCRPPTTWYPEDHQEFFNICNQYCEC
jgi:hypothetical protein